MNTGPATIREFTLEQLQASDELGPMQQRHAAYLSNWAEQVETRFYGLDQATWLARLVRELANLLATLTWLLGAGQVETAARMTCAHSRQSISKPRFPVNIAPQVAD